MTETVRQAGANSRVELEQRAAIKRGEDYATELKMHDYSTRSIANNISSIATLRRTEIPVF